MSAIFGICYLESQPEEYMISQLVKMKDSMTFWGSDSLTIKIADSAGFGLALLCTTPESVNENYPQLIQDSQELFTVSARLDNREELCDKFNIPYSDHIKTSDGKLAELAYRKWGEDASDHLFGDWAFAVYNGTNKTIQLVRDQTGNTALYYYFNDPLFAFSSDPRAIHELDSFDRIIDDKKLAHNILRIPNPELMNQSLWKGIYSLLPSHRLVISDKKLIQKKYWQLSDIPTIRYKNEEDYYAEMKNQITRAVSVRLRSKKNIGSTLSAGLDSGIVTSVAATELEKANKKLIAYTSIPIHENKVRSKGRLVNEWDMAQFVSNKYSNIIHKPVDARNLAPHHALIQSVYMFGDTVTAIPNAFWILEVFENSRLDGNDVMLTGQMGNASLTWDGGRNLAMYDLVQGNFRKAAKTLYEIKQTRGQSWLTTIRNSVISPILVPFLEKRKLKKTLKKNDYGLFNKDFFQQTGLEESIISLIYDDRKSIFNRDLLKERERIIDLNINVVSASWHRFGAFYLMDVRDPTSDIQLLKYCFGIPSELFSKNQQDRFFIRESMKGVLPERIRTNRIRGLQAADFAYRTLDYRDEIIDLLRNLSKNPAASYVLNFEEILNIANRMNQNQKSILLNDSALKVLTAILYGTFLEKYG